MLNFKERVKGLSGGDFIWYLLYTIVLVGFVFVFYYFIIAPTDIAVEGYSFSMGKVQANSVMAEILSSPDCLSTGEMAVLSEAKLNRKDGTEALDCAHHPTVWTYVEVEDHEKNKDYSFGNDLSDIVVGDITEWDVPVTIDTGSGNNLGTATFYMVHPPHFGPSTTRTGKIAWYEDGEPLKLETMFDKNHTIQSDKGKTGDRLKIDARIDDKGKATYIFKDYNLKVPEMEFDENVETSAVKKGDETSYFVEAGEEPCTYSRTILEDIDLYHTEVYDTRGEELEICCDNGTVEKCDLEYVGNECADMYECVSDVHSGSSTEAYWKKV
ncbi:MAG: hypothetical protein ACLFQ8_01285 [Candidatus Aenigmatarchaeota archaeon]